MPTPTMQSSARGANRETDASVEALDAEVQEALEGSGQNSGADDRDRQRLISETAYQRAEARGFAPGHELDDWLAAERELG